MYPRHQSEPLNQEGSNKPKQHAASNFHIPATVARSLSTSGSRLATSSQPTGQSILPETTNNLTTLPVNKHLNRPLTSSPLARQMTIIAEGVQIPVTSDNFGSSTTAIARENQVSGSPSAPEDRRYKFAASSPFIGFTFDGTEQTVKSVTNYDPGTASYFQQTLPYAQFGQANNFQEHALGRSPHEFIGPFEVHNQLRHAPPYGHTMLSNQVGEHLNVELNIPYHGGAQLEQSRSGHTLVHNVQDPFMRSEGRSPYSATPLTYPGYYSEPNQYDQSDNLHFEAAHNSQQLVLKSERATANPGNSVNYGQVNQRNIYAETTPTPGLDFEDTYIQANDIPYYLPRVSRGSPTLTFNRLYEFEHKKDITNEDHWWRSDSTYPHYPIQEQLYVKKIIMAMSEMDSANDNPGMLEMWSKLKKNMELLEITAWKLLVSSSRSS